MVKLWGTLTLALGLTLGGVAFANDEKKEDKGNAHDRITYPADETTEPIDEQEGEDETLPAEETFQPDLQSGQDEVDLSSLKGEKAMELQRKLQEKGFYKGAIDGHIGPMTKKALSEFQKEQGIEGSGKLDSQTASALGLSLSDLQPVSGEEKEGESKTEPQSGHEGEHTDPQSGMEGSGSNVDREADTQSGVKAEAETETDAETDLQAGTEKEAAVEGEQKTQVGTSVDIPKKDIVVAQEKLKKLGFFAGQATGTLDEETLNAVRKFQRSKGIPETGILDEQTCTALGILKKSEVKPQSGTDVEAEGEIDTQSGAETESDAADVEADTQSGMDVEADSSEKDMQSGDAETETQSGTDTGTGSQYGGTQTEGTGNDVAIDPQVGTDTAQQMTFDKETIKKVEQALMVRRIDVRVNGVLDKKEKKALKRFQTENGLTPTGKLDTETLAKLGVKAPEDVNKNKGDAENPANTTDPMSPPPDGQDPGSLPPNNPGGTNPVPR